MIISALALALSALAIVSASKEGLINVSIVVPDIYLNAN